MYLVSEQYITIYFYFFVYKNVQDKKKAVDLSKSISL